MRDVKSCDLIMRKRNETLQATQMKQLLCTIGKSLGFIVDIEEKPESELGDLGIRHDVLWYTKPPDWYTKLLTIICSREDLEPRYRELVKRMKLERLLYAAFEIEATDQTTKGMKGDISNLSKLPYGIIVVHRGKPEIKKGQEAVRNRFERALLEFQKLHGPNSVIICSFHDIEELYRELSR